MGAGASTESNERARRVLVIGGSPEPSSPETVRAAAFGCTAVVAVDRGLEAALAAGVPCDLFCGDGDSVGERAARALAAAEARALRSATDEDDAREDDDAEDDLDGSCLEEGFAGEADLGFSVERYHPHKDATDLELALDAVAERWPGATVRATCLTGGAPDHFLAVMGRLARWHGGADGEAGLELIENAFEARILHAGETWRIMHTRDRRFSFVALAPDTVVSEEGMRWNLDHKRVELLGDLGISNVIDSDEATITCHEGTVAAFLFDGYFAGA